jgi:5'-methylthioadenosine phosphorylase
MYRVAVIGGTGMERLPPDYEVEPLPVETRFGRAAAARARRGAEEFLFLSRHGEAHGIPPHRINYRANIAALVDLGVTRVLATNAAGSLRLDLPPGSLLLLDDFIDFTRGRPLSYWDDAPDVSASVVHTDFSQPYCPELREALIEAAARQDVELLRRGVYLCAEGPRFESPAEVRLFAQWGADVAGMTGLPEATFAREAGLCYAAVAIVTNYSAGLTEEPVAHEEVAARMASQVEVVRELLMDAARRLPAERRCRCSKA